jgi:tetratricopeptide (TPR) repeat protein
MGKAKESAAAIARISPYRGHFAAARIANKEKDLAGAEKAWRALWAAYPDSISALTNLVAFLSNNNRSEEALPIAEKFMVAHPGDVLGQWWFARTTAISGKQMDKGEEIINRLMTIPTTQSPRITHDVLHYRLGDIQLKRGDKAKAKASYQEALKINPKLEAARKALTELK